MAEVGVVRFAPLALVVGGDVLPAQRTEIGERQFTQAQLLALVCLMRYEVWTFREAEVRLGEHGQLRSALDLARFPTTPHYNGFCARRTPTT